MMHITNIKPELIRTLVAQRDYIRNDLSKPPLLRDQILRSWARAAFGGDMARTVKHAFIKLGECHNAAIYAEKGQTIVFSAEQAEIFEEAAKNYSEALDYKLPFPCVIIQFDRPLRALFPLVDPADGDIDALKAVMLTQAQLSADEYKKQSEYTLKQRQAFNLPDSDDAIDYSFNSDGEVVVNGIDLIYTNWSIIHVSWQSYETSEKLYGAGAAKMATTSEHYRRLAVSCIGYINCENIYLHQEGGAPDAVNRKREKQGKKILEPYYVCRIRGVQYDSNGEPTGEGTHHGFRYDVRGHFRKLSTGKTTWVRPHQRGLQHELYVPKTYVVTKEPA